MEIRALALLLGAVLLVGIVSSSAKPAYAETFTCDVSLDGSQEVPPVETEATGTASVMFDSETRELTWEIEFSGLSGDATAAHFHGPAAPGNNAGPMVDIGEISGLSSPISGSATLTEEQASVLLDGQMYINIHTAENPNGEIRGQVLCEEDSTEEPPIGEWQTAMMTYGDEEIEIQYMIVNGTLDELTGIAELQMITAEITAEQDGELTIQLPREVIDSIAGDQDLDYIVFVDEIQEIAEDDFGEDTRTLAIPFTEGSTLIDIVSASPPDVEPGLPSMIQTVSVAGEDIEVIVGSSSNITDFQFDEENKTISFSVDGEEGTEGVTEITIGRILEGPYTVTIDGEETTDFEVTERETGNVIRLSYNHGVQGVTITGTNVVPEFPVAAIALATAIVGIIVATAKFGKFSFLPKM
jgi:hypothetical protein